MGAAIPRTPVTSKRERRVTRDDGDVHREPTESGEGNRTVRQSATQSPAGSYVHHSGMDNQREPRRSKSRKA